MDRGELEGLDREGLVVAAQAAGIRRARILTRPELIDELLRLDPAADESQLRKSRGFFGRARDLVARVVERGLHLPDAAERIRTLTNPPPAPAPRAEPQAVPTVTLAEIYAAQGHRARAVETLHRVLGREPEHAAAQALLDRLLDTAYVAPAPPLPPEPEVEPEPFPRDEDDAEEAAPPTPVTGTFVIPRAFSSRAAVDAFAPTQAFARLPERDAAVDQEGEDDTCFSLPLSPTATGARMFTRWTLSPGTLSDRRDAAPGGALVVRAHLVTPSWDGPVTELRDTRLDPDATEAVLHGLPENAVVRVAVGWLSGATFVPLAHSPALDLTHGNRLTIWTVQGRVPVAADDPRAAPLAQALAAARRVTELHA